MSRQFKYCLSCTFSLIAFTVYSQPEGNQSNQAGITIVGDAPQTNTGNDPHDFINSNPYSENNAPQMQQELTAQNIEPTLENGFHIRFELNSNEQYLQSEQPILTGDISTTRATTAMSGGSSSSGGATSVGKSKKRAPSMTERSFNAKKRFRAWFPKRKKKYHPHLCGRF